jgi:hypothetical protein
MKLLMFPAVGTVGKGHIAMHASVWLFSTVNALVALEVAGASKSLRANIASMSAV